MTTTRHLHDSDTNEDLGPATRAQVEASDNASPEGHILIDADGDVVPEGSWDEQHLACRRVYVEAPPSTYIASIMNEAGDGLVDVDVRTLDTDRLAALRSEAGSAGDQEMVATIDEVLASR